MASSVPFWGLFESTSMLFFLSGSIDLAASELGTLVAPVGKKRCLRRFLGCRYLAGLLYSDSLEGVGVLVGKEGRVVERAVRRRWCLIGLGASLKEIKMLEIRTRLFDLRGRRENISLTSEEFSPP